MTISSADRDREQLETSYINVEMQNGTVTLERSSFLTKLDIHLAYDPAILLLEVKTHVHTKTCTRMFPAALFIMAPNWKQPKYPSGSEWI